MESGSFDHIALARIIIAHFIAVAKDSPLSLNLNRASQQTMQCGSRVFVRDRIGSQIFDAKREL
jgi:hypothetical protein